MSVRVMDFDRADREAYEAVNEAVLGSADELWDSQPGTGSGGTAQVVADAQQRGLSLTIIPPEGAATEYRT